MGKSLRLGIGKRWTSGSEVPVGDREEQAEATSRSQQRSETAYQSRLSIQHCPRQRSPRQRHTYVIYAARERLEPLERPTKRVRHSATVPRRPGAPRPALA